MNGNDTTSARHVENKGKNPIMMRIITVLVILLLVIPVGGIAQAQTSFKAGDFIYITAQKLPVYVQPETKATVVEEMIPGMVSHILKVQQDSTGTEWIYLADNAFGWVQSAIGGNLTIAAYSVETLQQFIDTQTITIKDKPQSVIAYLVRGTSYGSLHKFTEALADYDAARRPV
jgi:hypothetical protein